jgi:putative intracellular protease/amidase
MVISAADRLTFADGTQHPTGYWAEEVVTSHRVLTEAGFAVDFATPDGKAPTVDPLSLDANGGVEPAEADGFRAYLRELEPQLSRPLALDAVDPRRYHALYLPGGHAPMVDLAGDGDLGALLIAATDAGTPVAALCHGVAGLLSARNGTGWQFAGRSMTGFSDREEIEGGYGEQIPYFVEARLREEGAAIDPADPWTSHVVVDGNLITGQNPQSSAATADALVTRLRAGSRLSR